MLDASERCRLLHLARRSIGSGNDLYSPRPLPQEDWPAALLSPRATFVTLRIAGELRGCCGSVEPKRPLAEDVWHNAWVSAYADPRFGPVSAAEITSLEIAVSVLTPLEPIAARNDDELLATLEPGVDGLVLRCSNSGATFLPAVWDSVSDAREFLARLKAKAGWPPGYWPSGMTALRYRTQTFE
jgi:AmmeMemoRadiSam system protein A